MVTPVAMSLRRFMDPRSTAVARSIVCCSLRGMRYLLFAVMWMCESISPGMTVSPLQSMTRQPGGMATEAGGPALTMRSPSTRTIPCAHGGFPASVINWRLVMAIMLLVSP